MIEPFERACVCPGGTSTGVVPLAENGHTPACNDKHRVDFFAYLYRTRHALSQELSA